MNCPAYYTPNDPDAHFRKNCGGPVEQDAAPSTKFPRQSPPKVTIIRRFLWECQEGND